MGGTNDRTPGLFEGPGVHTTPEDVGGLFERLLGGAREQLESTRVEGMSGGGAVRVQMDGEQNVLAVKLSPEVVDPSDIALLEELIVSAMADAARQAQAAKMESVSALAEMFGLGSVLGEPPAQIE